MKTICVIGLGQFGYHLATYLARKGAQVIALDESREKINNISTKVTHAVIGDAKQKDVLAAIIPPSIDAVVVCLGDSIEASILCTLHLTQMKIKKIIVKAINDDHAEILKAVGADEIVFPERDMAEKTARALIEKDMVNLLSLTDEYSIKDIEPLPEFIGKSLKELELRREKNIYVIGIKNKEEENHIMILPPAETIIQKNHILAVLGKNVDINKLCKKE